MRTSDPELKRKRKKENRSLSWHVVDSNTAWLNAECIWHDDRICFRHQNNIVVPTANVLARAQRQLYGLSEKSEYKKNLDIDDWREHRLAKLETAKLLSSIRLKQPFDVIALGAKRGNSSDVEILVSLLIAEAVVYSELPFSSTKILAGLGDRSCAALHKLAQRKDVPSNVRRVAALALGANLKHGYDRKFSASSFVFKDEELRRSFYWGLKNGIAGNGEDAFFARILQDREGLDLSGRICAAKSRLKHLSIKPDLACRMLAAGIETNRLVELIEGLAAMEPLYVEMYRQQFDDHKNFSWNKEEREERQLFASQWKEIFFEILEFCLDTRALVALTSLSQWILSKYRPDSNHARVFRDLLNMSGFSPSLFAAYLRILDVHSEQLFSNIESRGEIEPQDRLRYCWEMFVFPIRKLLLSTQDPSLVESIVAYSIDETERFAQVDWGSANELKQVWRLYQKFVSGITFQLPTVHEFIARADDFSLSVQIVENLISLEVKLCADDGSSDPRFPRILSYFSRRKNGIKELASLIPDVMPRFLSVTPMCCGHNRIEELTFVHSLVKENAFEWSNWFYDFLRKDKEENQAMGCMQRDSWRSQFMLSTALSGGDLEQMQVLFSRLKTVQLPEGYLFSSESMTWLNSMEALVFALRIMFCSHSGRALSLLHNMLLIHNVCREPLDELRELLPSSQDWSRYLNSSIGKDCAFNGIASDENSWGMDDESFSTWKHICALRPSLGRLASAYFAASKENCVLPRSIMGELQYRSALIREREYIETCLARSGTVDTRLQKRILNIEKRFADPDKHLALMAERVHEKLKYHLAHQIFVRAEAIVLSAYSKRLSDIIGFYPKIESFDNDLFYAALLWLELTCNKALLRKLLKARMQNDHDWVLRQSGNKSFLLQMKDRGIDLSVWLAENSATYSAPFLHSGKVRLYMEQDPLKVLRMGHYFNTCLRFGGVNSFSVVTNAVDLNKRVIYACDNSGNVIARKLICITNEGSLLGYNLYFPTAVDDNYDQLRSIFKQYCQSIALKVGLSLAEDGSPELLCGEDWYDDIPVSWDKTTPSNIVAVDAADAAEAIGADVYAAAPSGSAAVMRGESAVTNVRGSMSPTDGASGAQGASTVGGATSVNPLHPRARGSAADSNSSCELQRIRNRNSSL